MPGKPVGSSYNYGLMKVATKPPTTAVYNGHPLHSSYNTSRPVTGISTPKGSMESRLLGSPSRSSSIALQAPGNAIRVTTTTSGAVHDTAKTSDVRRAPQRPSTSARRPEPPLNQSPPSSTRKRFQFSWPHSSEHVGLDGPANHVRFGDDSRQDLRDTNRNKEARVIRRRSPLVAWMSNRRRSSASSKPRGSQEAASLETGGTIQAENPLITVTEDGKTPNCNRHMTFEMIVPRENLSDTQHGENEKKNSGVSGHMRSLAKKFGKSIQKVKGKLKGNNVDTTKVGKIL